MQHDGISKSRSVGCIMWLYIVILCTGCCLIQRTAQAVPTEQMGTPMYHVLHFPECDHRADLLLAILLK